MANYLSDTEVIVEVIVERNQLQIDIISSRDRSVY